MDALRDHPLTRAAIKRNKIKACFAIQGIASGLVADRKLNELELLYLESWVRQHQEMEDDPDIVDICDLVSNILEDGQVTAEELEDLASLLDCIAEFRNEPSSDQRDSLNQLLGVLEGISADNVLNDREILFLRNWLANHPEVGDVWPGRELMSQVAEILDDGVIDDAERQALLESIMGMCGNSFMETGVAGGISARGFCDPVPENFSCNGLSVCLTGNFVSGRRKTVQLRLQSMGATIKTSVSSTLDVLVIGALVSPDWLYSSHGLKIQDALRRKQEGESLLLIAEEDFPWF